MARDFAHNAAPSKKQPAGGITSVMPVVAIIFVAAACFAAGYWLGSGDVQQTGNKTDVGVIEAQLAVKDAEAKMQMARIETLESLVAQWKAKAGAGAHTKVGELQFYKTLPKQSVMPAPVSAKADSKPVPKPAVSRHVASNLPASITSKTVVPVNTKSFDGQPYRIQIASFRHQDDANPLQEKIKNAGFPAFVRPVDLGDKGMWFRVYAGPFVSKGVAENKRQQIEMEMHLKGMLVRGN